MLEEDDQNVCCCCLSLNAEDRACLDADHTFANDCTALYSVCDSQTASVYSNVCTVNLTSCTDPACSGPCVTGSTASNCPRV